MGVDSILAHVSIVAGVPVKLIPAIGNSLSGGQFAIINFWLLKGDCPPDISYSLKIPPRLDRIFQLLQHFRRRN
jgi:hypothetical protein